MRIDIQSTSKTVELVIRRDGRDHVVPARVWEGYSQGGVEVIAFITRIAAKHDADLTEFERDLEEQQPPTADVAAWPARMVLP